MKPKRRLKHLAEIRASNVDKKTVEGDIPARLCNYVDVYRNETITDDLPFMEATATVSQVRQLSLMAGDVLITKDSETADDIGVPAYVPETLPGVVCGYHVSVLRTDRRALDPRFLYWVLRTDSVKHQFSVAAQGVTRFALGYADIGNLLIPLPDLARQRELVALLDAKTEAIDQLILKNQQMIDLLTTEKRAFVNAFIDSREEVASG